MKKRYLGITIGPIIETMSYTSTPVGLWASSFFFSSITRDLVEGLQKNNYKILTVPEQVQNEVKGIGQYHDRIYAVIPEGKTDLEVKDEANAVIDNVIEKRAEEVYQALSGAEKVDKQKVDKKEVKECLHKYLQIHFIIRTVEDTEILAKTLADALDALENCQSTVGNLSQNALLRMLAGKKDDSNKYLKKYKPYEDAEMLHKNGDKEHVKDLHTIACGRNQTSGKLNNYFAIIQADGDGMGKIINADLKEQVTLEEQEERIQKFSELCMEYTAEASKLIKAYNGVVIYAGGDDLLFLAPIVSQAKEGANKENDVQNDSNANIWTLCRDIGKKFNEIFNPKRNPEAGKIVKIDQVPSISFGVSVNYYKFPLYEAFEDARHLLFGVAKNFAAKNNFAISVHKASGQTSGYVCCMESKDESEDTIFENLISYINSLVEGREVKTLDNNQMLHSLVYHIENQNALFKLAIKDDDRHINFFKNVFDSSMQKNYAEYISKIEDLSKQIANVVINVTDDKEKKISILTQEKEAGKEAVAVLTNVLRTSKFLVEERE